MSRSLPCFLYFSIRGRVLYPCSLACCQYVIAEARLAHPGWWRTRLAGWGCVSKRLSQMLVGPQDARFLSRMGARFGKIRPPFVARGVKARRVKSFFVYFPPDVCLELHA